MPDPKVAKRRLGKGEDGQLGRDEDTARSLSNSISRDLWSWVQFAKTLALVLIWYAVNIALLLANKWLISLTGFNATNTLTLFHMLTSAAASYALVHAGFYPAKPLTRALLWRITVLAASFTVSVAACMASLAYLPASFVQAMGSTTPVFTAMLAFTMQGRREALVTYLSLLPVVGGIALASGGEPLFNVIGLLLQLLACFSRSFKTVLQALMLTDERDRFHPMALLAHTSAISALLLLPLALASEPGALRHAAQLHGKDAVFLPLLLLSCALAFLVNLTNFIISKQLGALTLQVLGNFKNVVAAIVSVAVFANPVTPMGVTGYVITTVGVFTYSNLVRVYPASTARGTTPGGTLAGGGSKEDRESGVGAMGALTPNTMSLSDLEAGIGVGSGGLGGRGGSGLGLGGEGTGSGDGLGRKDQDRGGGREWEREGEREPLLGVVR